MKNAPAVMVSSIVLGFEDVRQAAREAIESCGGRPILVNEDFPSRAESSRNVCLDAVAESDVLVVIVGKKGGWTAPSGRLVVDEEYSEAVRLRRPVLAFFEETQDRDEEAKALGRRISDYVEGRFRKTYKDLGELRSLIAASLEEQFTRLTLPTMPSDSVSSAIAARSELQLSGEATLRVVVAPSRQKELIDPRNLGSEDLAHQIMEIGHRRDVGLLDYGRATKLSVQRDALRIEQAYNGRTALVLAVSEAGVVSVEADTRYAGRPRPVERGFGAMEPVAAEDIEARLTQALRFCAALYEAFDPYLVHQEFQFNAALLGLGHYRIERNPQPRNSMTMRTSGGDGAIVAYDAPRGLGRQSLLSPREEAERAVTKIMRASEEPR